ncbi:3-hydroxyisobutyrate dehydrogenase-like beta-hydroxyacid dehydrogenase [Altererythrobacter atlanticus]|uniref:NAD binding domain of 6-phosphogluconate dehydrogenase n=1 Tax=Croceibacterium atlanticum TaxID=1267766 RepID=A0A0F7KVZ5_9SPHN|nr:NAD(P)-dependent oxidoreductase [Croceibacterium atlanticum]AKH42940.1 NAD binding domain of 6-phosphogluconate dehydrogenase [Croceibacterium atlanticum]MBB5734103.1 3-hydroxyisobutyrate dehydrogenase-like beta-hydroxyacid dehydrogenase [Croceibacterium atlanticum]
MNAQTPSLTLIGFGEAGFTFALASGWEDRAIAWDTDEAKRAAMEECGVRPAASAKEALDGAVLVLCLVTADQALKAAQEYAPFLPEGAIWCDMNSVAPETKRAAAQAVESAGGRYVDVAVMAPVDPARMNVPLLFAGPAAQDAMMLMRDAGFAKTRIVGEDVGRASAIKMIRSVMVKGLEALSSECAAAADAAGVFDEVMTSLDASEKTIPWAERVAYNRERMETHGLRRAAEMEESAKTLLGLGVEPVMTRGTVELQRRAANANQERN